MEEPKVYCCQLCEIRERAGVDLTPAQYETIKEIVTR